MGFLIGLLTVVMVLDCLVLMFLVLIQLPKKEAGAGLAFGAGATDALFGAGSGNVLTKITKYSAAIFFVLAIVLSVMQRVYHTRSATEFQKGLEQPITASPVSRPPATPAPASTPAVSPVAAPSTNNLLSPLPVVESTNLPGTSPAATNATGK